jgi:hypothetical protein
MQQPHLQLCRPLGSFVEERKYPSQGGNPYLQDMREEVIIQYQLGFPMVTPELTALREQYLYLSVKGAAGTSISFML